MCARGESRTRVVRWWLLLFAGILASAPGAALAADPAAIDTSLTRGVAQLEGAQSAAGSVGSRLAVRDTATAAEAVHAARPSSAFLADAIDYLQDQDETDVDSTSRTAIATRVAADAQPLLDDQRPDGGFGLSAEYESDPLDTALAIRALVAADERTPARKALDKLLAFRTGGSWGTDGDPLLTSEALLAVAAYTAKYGSTTAYETVLADGSAWLAGQQESGGAWGEGTITTRTTASAVAGLAKFAAYAGRVEAGTDLLLTAQRPDGSWGDPYTSALAIRALAAAKVAIERANRADLADPAIRARDLSSDPPTVEPGKDVTVTAIVHNPGLGEATGVVAEFHLADPTLGGTPVATANVPTIAPDGQVSVAKTFAVNKPVGRHKVYLVLRTSIDDDRDLANNRAALNLFVRAARSTYPKTKDWPRAGRDLQHSGATPNRLHAVVDNTPIWRHRSDGGHIVAEGKVFFGEAQHVTARDAKTGELVWENGSSYPAGDFRYRAPIYNRGFIYTAGIGSSQIMGARTGETAGGASGWGGDVPIFGVEVLPVQGNYDPVFMYLAGRTWVNGDGRCHIWPYRDPSGSFNQDAWAGDTVDGYTSAGILKFDRPCGDDQLAFTGNGSDIAYAATGDSLLAFNPISGRNGDDELEDIFAVEIPGMAKTDIAPLMDSLNQIVVAGWEGQGDDTNDATPPDADSVETGRGKLVALDPADGSVHWSFTTDARLDGSPIEYKGAIIVVDRSGRVYAVDQTTGTLKWSWIPPSWSVPAEAQQEKAGQTLARSGRYLYVPHPNGSLYTLDARNGTALSSTAFPARPYDLAIDDTNNAIYVRTLDGWVGAYATQELPEQCAPDPFNPAPAPGAMLRASAQGDGSQLNVRGAAIERPSFSGDGKQLAYVRETGTTYWEGTQISIKNLETGATTEIPFEDINGTTRIFNKTAPVLSSDGRYLAMAANEFDSVTGHIGDQPYVLDRATGVTEPVLKKPDGTTRPIDLDDSTYLGVTNQANPPVSMSGDGRYVAFATRTSLVPEDTDGQVDAYLVDRTSGDAILVSRTDDPALAAEPAFVPSLSRDGRYVAFNSYGNFSSLTPSSSLYDPPYAFLFDRVTGAIDPVSVTADGTQIGQGWSPSVSADGSTVAFMSNSAALMPQPWRNLNAGAIGGAANAYVWNRSTGRTSIITINDSERVNYSNAPLRPTLSADGSYVAFQNIGYFTKTSTTKFKYQVVGRDLRPGGTAKQISYNGWGVSGNGDSYAQIVSPDGRKVAFVSDATDLVDGDTNGLRDVFVLDRDKEPTTDAPFDDDEPTGVDCGPSGEAPAGYSDLNVTTDDIRPGALEQGQDGTVEIDVRNQGDTASEATSVRLYDGTAETGTLIAEQPLAELAPNAAATVTFSWPAIADAGAHRLTVVVDPGEAVFQQDFADDEAARDVTVAAPQFTLTTTSSEEAYEANETASFSAAVDNASIAQRTAGLELTIRDAAGEHVGTVYDGPVSLLAGGHIDVPATWNTQDTNAGSYTLRARLLNADGDELKVATRAFTITAQVAPSLTIEPEQPVYEPSATATVRALVENGSVNARLVGTTLDLALKAPDGSLVQQWQLSPGEVERGRTVAVSQDQSLKAGAPGVYTAEATLRSATGQTLATASTTFRHASSAEAGGGIAGTISATPQIIDYLAPVTFNYSVTNTGNADVSGAVLRVRLSDTATGVTKKTVDSAPRSIGRSAPAVGSISTIADVRAPRDYQASLYLVTSTGEERPLARTVIRVLAPPALPVTTGASFDTSARSGVLVWACDRADETAARTALAGTFASFVPDRSDPRYANTNGCGLFTSDEQKVLLRLLRSGDYNQIWLLGRSTFLELNLANEIAARVIHGDSLLIAGTSLGFDLNLFGNKSPLGASGNLLPLLPGSYSLAFPSGSPFAGAQGTVVGLPTALNLGTASAAATTTYGIWPLRVTSTLGSYNAFGNGKAAMFGASPKMFSNATDAAGFLTKAKSSLQPAASAVRPGGIARLDLWVEGQSPGTPLEVRATLPAGAGLLDKPADVTLSGSTLTVPFSATGTARRTRSVWVKLPPASTSISVTQTAYAKNASGTFVAVSPPATSGALTVPATRAAAVTGAQTALNAVTAPNSYERAKLDAIKARVAAIATDTASSTLAQTRITATLSDIGTIEKSNWTGTTPAWKALATLVTYVEFDYYRYGGQ